MPKKRSGAALIMEGGVGWGVKDPSKGGSKKGAGVEIRFFCLKGHFWHCKHSVGSIFCYFSNLLFSMKKMCSTHHAFPTSNPINYSVSSHKDTLTYNPFDSKSLMLISRKLF